MSSAPAPSRRQRWLKRGRVLVFGGVLGLLQILLVLGLAWLAPWPFAWAAFVVLSVFCSLAIPALAGFLAFRPDEDPSSEFPPGFLVGGIGFLVSLLALWSGLLPLASLACPPGSCQGWGFGLGGVLVLTILGALWLLEALFAGPLGGWVGGVLGKRRASAPNESGGTAADQARL